MSNKTVEVKVIRRSFRDADGAIHRRRIEVRQLTVEGGLRVIIPPVDMRDTPHQQGGDTYKGRFQFPRSANHIRRVGRVR